MENGSSSWARTSDKRAYSPSISHILIRFIESECGFSAKVTLNDEYLRKKPINLMVVISFAK